MTTIYSTQFAAGAQAAGTASAVYTVPAGMVAVIRSIELGPQNAPASLCAINNLGVAEIFAAEGGPQYVTIHADMRCVLTAGDVIQVDALAGAWSYIISGYLLTI